MLYIHPMQGQRSSMGSLPDFISFDLNPTATDAGSLPDFISFDLNPTATNANVEQPVFWNNNTQNHTQNMTPGAYLNSGNQAQNLSGWNMGESSSSGTQNYVTHNERKISIREMDLNETSFNKPYSPLFLQGASNNTFPQNRSMSVEVGGNSGNYRHVIEENMRAPPSNGGYFGEEIYSSEGSRLSCKRKAIEGHIGQSSSSGSSSYFQPRESKDRYNTHFNPNTSSTSLENPFYTSSQDQINVRLGLRSNANTFDNTLPLMTPNLESSRRSHHVRISSPPQLSPSPVILPNLSISGNSNSNISHLNNFQGTRTPQLSRWSRGSSSRPGHSLSFSERISRPNEELGSNPSLRNIPELPIFLPRSEASRDLNQMAPHTSENVSRSGLARRTPPRYSRRLSEYLRRISEPVGQSSNTAQQPGLSSQQAMGSSGAGGNPVDRLSRLRSALLLERQLDGALEGASSSQRAAAGPEGRRQLVSEIRNVLDLMRRGEGLRFEDVVFLDQSIFFGMADIHDRHRDMRLDVDNMSYEELLALEERMGSVSTGLSEETILKGLKQRKFFSIAMGAQSEVEPCCICREEYNDGEDIGTVECGHEFHSGCIKQWLMLKNSCPICKTTALNK